MKFWSWYVEDRYKQPSTYKQTYVSDDKNLMFKEHGTLLLEYILTFNYNYLLTFFITVETEIYWPRKICLCSLIKSTSLLFTLLVPKTVEIEKIELVKNDLKLASNVYIYIYIYMNKVGWICCPALPWFQHSTLRTRHHFTVCNFTVYYM